MESGFENTLQLDEEKKYELGRLLTYYCCLKTEHRTEASTVCSDFSFYTLQ